MKNIHKSLMGTGLDNDGHVITQTDSTHHFSFQHKQVHHWSAVLKLSTFFFFALIGSEMLSDALTNGCALTQQVS